MIFKRMDYNMKYDFSKEKLAKVWTEKYGSPTEAIFAITGTKIVSDTVEDLYAEYTGGEKLNKEGYDCLHPDGTKDEIKSTGKILKCGSLRINGLRGKEGKCDNIVIVDCVNNRTSIIPSVVFFAESKFYYSKDAGAHMFYWSGTYNENDRIQQKNTQLFLEYEVK